MMGGNPPRKEWPPGEWPHGGSPRGRRRDEGRDARGQERRHLSREEVVRTALAIVDREGLDAFSMRKLGAELGVDPMAAYHYFPNKAAVLDGIVEAVYAELPSPPDADAPWDARMREVMRGYRQVLCAHPHTLPVLSTHPSFSEAVLAQWEVAGMILHDAGLPPVDALEAIGVLAAYVIGRSIAEVGQQPGGVPDPTEEDFRARAEMLPVDKFPLLIAAYRSQSPYDPDGIFERGLDLILAGIGVRLAATGAGTGTTGAISSPVRGAADAPPPTSRGPEPRG